MPYTLAKGFVWVALAIVLGIVIGWLLRSIVAKRQVARARSLHVDTAEMERLRGRVANLESVVHERDQLRAQLDELRTTGPATADSPAAVDAAVASTAPIGASPSTPPSAPDVSQAEAVLGRSITLDDLKAIEGIGPKIESLCNGIGIRTWFDMSTTEVSLLRTMLADAGPRFKSHDPSTWPDQAALLAHGRWDEFLELTDRLQGGRTVD